MHPDLWYDSGDLGFLQSESEPARYGLKPLLRSVEPLRSFYALSGGLSAQCLPRRSWERRQRLMSCVRRLVDLFERSAVSLP